MTNSKKLIIIFIVFLSFACFAVFRFWGYQNSQNEKPTPVANIEQEIITSANNETAKEILENKTVTKIKKIDKTKKASNKKTDKSKDILPTEKPENIQTSIPAKVETEPVKPIVNEDMPKKKKLFAYDIKRFSDVQELREALKLLEDIEEEDVIKNIQKYSMRIKFDDFNDIVYKRDSYFAMSAYNQYGTRYILINSIYKNAPTEQLACLIAHESMHILKSPTLEEEAMATKKEAACWNKLRIYSKEYPNTKLTARLNKLANKPYSQIEKQISAASVYHEQYSK